jgi:hypothetical protein
MMGGRGASALTSPSVIIWPVMRAVKDNPLPFHPRQCSLMQPKHYLPVDVASWEAPAFGREGGPARALTLQWGAVLPGS